MPLAVQIGRVGQVDYQASPTVTTNRNVFITLGLMDSAPVAVSGDIPTAFFDTDVTEFFDTDVTEFFDF